MNLSVPAGLRPEGGDSDSNQKVEDDPGLDKDKEDGD